jgi:hypothetical protein
MLRWSNGVMKKRIFNTPILRLYPLIPNFAELHPYLLICGKFFLYDILCMSFSWFEIDYT